MHTDRRALCVRQVRPLRDGLWPPRVGRREECAYRQNVKLTSWRNSSCLCVIKYEENFIDIKYQNVISEIYFASELEFIKIDISKNFLN